MAGNKERRVYHRVASARAIHFQVLDEKLGFRSAEVGEQTNISAGGICLLLPRPLELETLLELTLPIKESEEYAVLGKIAWRKEVREGDTRYYAHGVSFVDLPEHQRKSILQHVFKTEVSQKKKSSEPL